MEEKQFEQEGYIPFFTNRDLNFYKEGTYVDPAKGGVLILVKSNLNPVEVKSTAKAEIKWVKIYPTDKIEVVLGVAYHPDLGGLSNVEQICNSINHVDNSNVILLGDFNLRDINWDTRDAPSQASRLFLETLEQNNLEQLVTEPTHGKNLIDLVITGNTDLVDKVVVTEPFSTSDHCRTDVWINIPIPRVEAAPRTVYLYSKGDYEGYNKELGSVKWDEILDGKSVNQQWDIIKDAYYHLRDKYIPSKTVKANYRHKPPWTRYRSVKLAHKHKRKAFVKSRISGLNADNEIYKDISKDCKITTNVAKAHYENKLVDAIPENPKLFFNYARNFTRSSSTIDCLEHDGIRITEDTEKANLLNSYFASVMTKESFDGFSPLLPPPIIDGVYRCSFTPKMVREKLEKLKKNKGSGIDNFNVNVMSQTLNWDTPLCKLFNNSIQTGVIPQDWRDANITPLFKKGSRMSANNYRPVSLTSQVCKLLERLILDILWSHINKNNIISCQQHGFQENCSCVSQLLECLQDWTKWTDEGDGVDSIYLDFSKAFDSVPHSRLLQKLENLGIRGQILSWIGAFLQDRRQRVLLKNGTSDWEPVISGVPQGSILGPVLFLLYVNDLPDITQNTAKMFADDTKLYARIQDEQDCENLQRDLNHLSVWSRQWLLNFNADKCVVLRIKSSLNYIYTLNGTYLQEVKSQKDLGVTISNTLHPSNHISTIVKRANSRIYMIKRCFTGLTQKKVLTLYTSLVRPILEYASPVWSPWQAGDKELLEKTQRKCLRLCQEDINLESLESRRDRMDLVETFKFKKGCYKTLPTDMFTPSHTGQLRGHSEKIFKEQCRLDTRKYFFTQRVVKPWNKLSQDAVSQTKADAFKKILRVAAKPEAT